MSRRIRGRSTLWRWRWALAVVGTLVVLVGVVAVLKNPDGQPAAAAGGDARSITTLDGQTVRVPMSGWPTAVFFFAVGSGECVTVMSELSGIAKAHPDVYYLAVDVNPADDPDSVRRFLAAANDPQRPAALDAQGRLANAVQVRYLGEFIVYDAAGTETFRDFITGSDQSQTKFADAFTKVSKETAP